MQGGSSERINTGRQPEIDIAKGLSVLFMILVHAMEQFAPEHRHIPDGIHFAVELLGSPFAAPVFMVAMGVGLVYSRKQTPARMARRGLFLMGLGYLLNVMSDIIPTLIYDRGQYSAETVQFMAQALIGVDILGFAGVFFLFWALFTHLKRRFGLRDHWLIVIWIALAAARPFLPELEHAPYGARAVTALIWGSSEASYFPFILWMFYPMLGYFFGQRLIRAADKRRFYRNVAIAGACCIAVAAIGMRLLRISFAEEILDAIRYYHHGPLLNIAYGGIVLAWLPVCYVISLHVPGPLMALFERWSRHLNALFCAQWIVLGSLQYAPIAQTEATMGQVLLLSLLILVVSDASSSLYLKLYARRRSAT